MSKLGLNSPAPRKVMTLFYVIDASGSMSGKRITTVNTAMQETFPLLEQVAAENDDAEIKVAILKFSSGCQWITPSPANLAEIKQTFNPVVAGGLTDFGAALKELDKKLSRNEFLNVITGAYAPVIILMSDGGPTDGGVWPSALAQLKKNNWFKNAIKIAIDIESGSQRTVLEQFTGNSEAILEAKNMAALKNMIYKVSVRASQFQSHSKDTETSETTAEEDAGNIVTAVINEIKDENSVDLTATTNIHGSWDTPDEWGPSW